MSRISINKEVTSLFIIHLIHTQLQRIAKEEKDIGARGKSLLLLGYCLTVLGFTLVLILSQKKLWGFLHLWFPQGKTLCSLSLVFDCCACCSLNLNILMICQLNVEKLTLLLLYNFVLVSKYDCIQTSTGSTIWIQANPNSSDFLVGNSCTLEH